MQLIAPASIWFLKGARIDPNMVLNASPPAEDKVTAPRGQGHQATVRPRGAGLAAHWIRTLQP